LNEINSGLFETKKQHLNYNIMLTRFKIIIAALLLHTSVFAQYNVEKVKALRNQIRTAPDSLIGSLYNQVASEFFTYSIYDSVQSVANEMVIKAGNIHNRKMESYGYVFMAMIENEKGNYDKAAERYLQALKIKEEIKDIKGQSTILLNLGTLYYERNNLDLAIEFNKKALALKIQLNDKKGEALIYQNLASISDRTGKSDQAIKYYTQSKELAIAVNDSIDIAGADCGLARQYLNLNNFKEAERLTNEAYAILLKKRSDRDFSTCLLMFGKIYRAEGNYRKSVGYFKEVYRYSLEKESPFFIAQSADGLSRTYEKSKQFDSAYYFKKIYSETNDSILGAEMGKQIADMQVKYETEKKQKEIVQLDKENNSALLALSQKRNQISLIIGISLFIIITVIAFYFYNNTKKQKEIIEAIIATEEKERKKIASDLHDGIGQTLSAARIGLGNLETTGVDSEKIKNVSELINVSLDELKAMAGNLMPLALKGKGLTESIQNICRQFNKPNVQEVSFKTYNLPNKLQPIVEINTYRICQELLNNSVKYSKAKEIFLQLFCRDNKLIIQFEDNGIGFDKDKIKEGSLGMNILKERVALLKGEMEIESAPQKGTNILIEFLV
jgi:two-component system NarL family sensor kinase